MIITIADGAYIVKGALLPYAKQFSQDIKDIVEAAPVRFFDTKYRPMTVGQTNCGKFGWCADTTKYYYSTTDPMTGKPWPAMPQLWIDLAKQYVAEHYPRLRGYNPDSCLINRYGFTSKLGMHQDNDEKNLDYPIVSFNFGLSANFLWKPFGLEKPQEYLLEHGDLMMFGGKARKVFHGATPPIINSHTAKYRWNLTIRQPD